MIQLTMVYIISFHCQDIQAYVKTSGEFPYPIIADPMRAIAKQLGMIDPDEVDARGVPLTCRAVRSLSNRLVELNVKQERPA